MSEIRDWKARDRKGLVTAEYYSNVIQLKKI